MSTRLYIIRHGEAVVNVERILGGVKGCQGLTQRGHEQAAKLGQRLATGEIKVDTLYASTILRARETAQYVAEGLKLPIQWDDELHESRPGDEADGMTEDEARERYYAGALKGPYQSTLPGGESQVAFMTRAGAALSRIVQQHEGQSIAVVAHGGIIDSSFSMFLGLSPFTFSFGGFNNRHTSIVEWRRFKPDDPNAGERWFLERFNDTRHLD